MSFGRKRLEVATVLHSTLSIHWHGGILRAADEAVLTKVPWSFVAGCTVDRGCWLCCDAWRISWTPPSWLRYSWRHQGNRGELNQKHNLTELNPAYSKCFTWKTWMGGRVYINDTIRGSPRDVVFLGWPIAPSYMSPNAGEGGGVAGFQPKSKAVHMEPK